MPLERHGAEARDRLTRTPCEVPFCKRTRARNDQVTVEGKTVFLELWVCSKHWRLADEKVRRVYTRNRRRLSKTGALRYAVMMTNAFNKARRQAIERAGGI